MRVGAAGVFRFNAGLQANSGRAAAGRGAGRGVFLQPESVFEDDRFLSPHDRAVKRTTEAGYGQDAVALMKEARRLFPALFAKHGVPYTEIGAIATPATSDEKLYVDHLHLMPAGARIAAQRMLPVVLERLRRQLRAPTVQPDRPGATEGLPGARGPRRPLLSTPTPSPLGAGLLRRGRRFRLACLNPTAPPPDHNR
jgi:hypothetical protein